MTDLLLRMLTGINAFTNRIGEILQVPVAAVPGWFSLTVFSAAVGVLVLIVFKYTSNQKAIGRVRDDIKANLLAVKLFKDSFSVAFRSQARVFADAIKLLAYSIVPLLVIILPVCLILAQMGAWYQYRPVPPDEGPVMVKLRLHDVSGTLPQVMLDPTPEVRVVTGPVRVFSKGEMFWKVQPVEKGKHTLVFHVGEGRYEKQMAIGEGFMRVSPTRPGASLQDVLLYPLEKPFASHEPVRSISIDYPARDSRIYGTDWWIVYFFLVSTACALAAKPFLKVRI